MIRSPYPLLAPVFLAALGLSSARAHESWVEPSSFRMEPGGRLGVRICVGDDFNGWSLARDPTRIAEFVAAGQIGDTPVVGLEGADPAGVVRLTEPGDYVVVYHSKRMFLEVPHAEFDEFLREKGLDQVLRTRSKRRPQGAMAREAYARHSKALIRVGPAAGPPMDRRIGLELELVAESAHSGERKSWTFRLWHRDRPLAGALVVATRLGTADSELKVRTGDDGRARIALREPGVWRVAAVHMLPAPHRMGAEWESLWTSLTFELAPRDGDAAAQRLTAAGACRNRLPPSSASAHMPVQAAPYTRPHG